MKSQIYAYDPTAKDPLSKVRGVGRYLQILRENFSGEWIFTDKLKQIPADAVFINPFFNFIQPPLTAGRIAKKQIAVIHDLIGLKYPQHFPVGIKGKLNIFLNKLALRNYDVIVTDSQASKKDIVEILKVDENKVKLIYPTLPRIFTNSELNSELLNLNSKFCIYVGDATWNKNLVNLAKAIKIINVTCVFVGKIFGELKVKERNFHSEKMFESREVGRVFSQENFAPNEIIHPWLNELKAFSEETKNDKRFKFAGFAKDYELVKFYQQARLNLLLSRDEGFGFSYLEAASQMCPSVLSDIPVLREISDGKGAIFAKPQDLNEIANTIGEIYFKKDIRNTIGSEALNRSKYFNSKLFVKSFSLLLKNL